MSSSRLKFKDTQEDRKEKKKRVEKTKKSKTKRSRREQLDDWVKEKYADPTLPSFYDDGTDIPGAHSHKQEPSEFVSLWDDVDDEPGSVQDFWQAQWSRPDQQAKEDAAFESYDAWADGIAEEMHRKHRKLTDSTKRRHKHDEEKEEKRKRKAAEAAWLAEERQRKHEELKKERLRYRTAWTALKSTTITSNLLTLKAVPLPVRRGETVSKESVASFLFDGCDFSSEEKRRMLKDSLLLWHPDKFARNKTLFDASSWDAVGNTVKNVSQALNALYSEL
ncbi:hypothetical protein DFJ77DRAFT_319902 [Powellomyces hirtus]|nr:hypothetical protein DFJ77DRAFT_319902 [Powellomyces hirtus]